MWFSAKPMQLPSPDDALSGRDTPMNVHNAHFVLNTPIQPPFAEHLSCVQLGMGCFWGAERAFWTLSGVCSTAVGYAAGITPNPTYKEVCTGMTGHNEVVLVVYDASQVRFEDLLTVFWESHNPTQGMRQGNDRGTQYRSGIYIYDNMQLEAAKASRQRYQQALSAQGLGAITTEIQTASTFYYAETEHQQYLAKNPSGYCGLGGTGVPCS